MAEKKLLLLNQEKVKAEDNLAKRESTQDILLRNAITSLNTSNPTNVILQDILLNDLYSPEIDDAYTDEYFNEDSLYKLFEQDYTEDEEGIYIDTDLPQNSGIVSSDFDYDDFSHPDYLSNVAGKTITMPNGEVRTYSPDGTSYNIPGEPWMGFEGAGSTYQITTHNKFSGMAYPEPNKQYIGISGDIGIPLAIGATSVVPSIGWKGALGAQALYQPKIAYNTLSGALGWLYDKATSGFENNSEDTDASGTHTTSHGSPTATGKVY